MISEQLIKILQKHPGKEVLLAPDAEGRYASTLDEASPAYVDKDFTEGINEELWEPGEVLDESDPLSEIPSTLREVLVLYPV